MREMSKIMFCRRRLLQTLLGSTAAWSLARFGIPEGFAAAPPGALTVERLSDSVVLIAGAGGNVLSLSGPDGMVLVDCGSPEHAGELLKMLSSLPGGKSIRTVFNTHWHWEHTGANEVLRKAGADIIAHENTRLWLGTQIIEAWQDRTFPPRPPLALPTHTFYYKSSTLQFGDEAIEYGYLGQAHTDGDIYVYLRRQNVLMTGDVLSVGSYPILDYCTGGWIVGMLNATQKLLELSNDQTRIIPGSGPVQTRADLKAEHDMLAAVRDKLWELMRKGLSPSEIIAARASGDFDAKWGNPNLFLSNAYQGMYGHIAEFLGKGVV
jgi:glyoxylase-like metal-dependent hydrolase (beta-lactamase superfamily II)